MKKETVAQKLLKRYKSTNYRWSDEEGKHVPSKKNKVLKEAIALGVLKEGSKMDMVGRVIGKGLVGTGKIAGKAAKTGGVVGGKVVKAVGVGGIEGGKAMGKSLVKSFKQKK